MMIEFDNDRIICILKNIRNNMSKAKNKRTENWVIVSEYFGLGTHRAGAMCSELGIDPFGYEVR